MAPLYPSPSKYKPAVTRHKSAEPLPPPLPPKAIDLNSSTRSTDRETGGKVTRRAFLCDVVVERDGEETANILAHLGEPLKPLSTLPPPPPSTNGRPTTPSRLALSHDEDEDEGEDRNPGWSGAKKEEMKKRLDNLIEELVRTERSYLSRVHALKTAYADRLRLYAKDPNQQLIPPYEAKAMFANIEAILPASVAFLSDLEGMLSSGRPEELVGDVCLKHFKTLRTFDPYRTYLSKQDESQKLFQDSLRKFSGFASFIESTKYQTTGIGNIGLRELLMEPVQRIPPMIKCMSPLSTQRAKLLEAIEVASRIARCEPDAQTVRATVMYNLERNIDDFPAKLFSNNRDYIDAIDVEDLPAEYPTQSSPYPRPISVASSRAPGSTASTPSMASSFGSLPSSSHMPQSPQAGANGGSAMQALHCTLFLFDDKLMIVKRQSTSVSGRKLTGTDDVQRLVKTGGGVAVMEKNNAKRDKLSFRGEVDVLDVIASDVGNGDFHLFLERPPIDQSGRWAGRPFRSYTTVHPPYSVSLDPVATKRDKLRFVQNLWAAQALARAKLLPSSDVRAVPRVSQSMEEVDLDAAGEALGRAKCFWNVWDRKGWEGQRKGKVVVHIDEDGCAPELPSVDGSNPLLSIYLQPMAGGLCRFSYFTAGEEEEGRSVIEMSEVTAKIATTIHRHGIFMFRTGTISCPTTPSAGTHRLRPSMLNLDTISRNLFGAGSVSGRSGTSSSDMFSTSSSKRGSKSVVSRSSTMETSLYSMDIHEEKGNGAEKELSAVATTAGTVKKRLSRMSMSPEPSSLMAGAPYKPSNEEKGMGQSEIDLNERLDMARKNSRSAEAASPGPTKLGTRSVAELRSQHEAEAAESRASTSPAPPVSPAPATAPLRIRKTPSPTRALSPTHDDTPQARRLPTAPTLPTSPITAPLNIRKTPSIARSARSDDTAAAGPSRVTSPPLSAKSSVSVRSGASGLSRRPTGPRSPPPGPRSPQPHASIHSQLPPPTSGVPPLGSGHTRLRIVSGGGRRVSLNRETVSLKGGDENDSAHSTPTAHPSAKRQHSSERLSPRKRSPSLGKGPLGMASQPVEAQQPYHGVGLGIRSAGVGSGRRVSAKSAGSGATTPLRNSGVLTSARTVSASQSINSVVSVASHASGVSGYSVASVESGVGGSTACGGGTEDVEMVEYPDMKSAMEATVKKIHDARGSTKWLKSEVASLRKQMTKDAKSKNLAPRLDRNGSLPRSPQKRNIHRMADQEAYDPYALSRQGSSGKKEIDTIVMDECARGISSIADRVDGHLRQAEADVGQALAMGEQLVAEADEKKQEIASLRNQLQRSGEHREVLQRQLGDVQMELDVIYEAFNTELDGMFNDAQLPETEAFQALRNDLQVTKANRNVLQLENQKLKRELEEANLKREQWARMLRAQGYAV
ncbi:hypothetical protein IAT38_003572 [Cryptococcus sp. DSM 104549]